MANALCLLGIYDIASYIASLGVSHIGDVIECDRLMGAIDKEIALSRIRNYDYIVLEAHGLPDRLSLDGKTLITETDAPSFEGKVVFDVSCDVGAELGKVIAEYAKSFTGWTRKFVFVSKLPQDPFQDPYAIYFFKPLLAHPEVLASGGSTYQAHLAMLDSWAEEINYWLKVGTPIAALIVASLAHNRNYQVTYGDAKVKLEKKKARYPLLLLLASIPFIIKIPEKTQLI